MRNSKRDPLDRDRLAARFPVRRRPRRHETGSSASSHREPLEQTSFAARATAQSATWSAIPLPWSVQTWSARRPSIRDLTRSTALLDDLAGVHHRGEAIKTYGPTSTEMAAEAILPNYDDRTDAAFQEQ